MRIKKNVNNKVKGRRGYKKETSHREATNNHMLQTESLCQAVLDVTHGNPFTIVKCVDSYLFAIELLAQIIPEQHFGRIDEKSGEVILTSEDRNEIGTNYTSHFNIIYPMTMYTVPLVGMLEIPDRVPVSKTTRDRFFLGAFTLFQSAIYTKTDPTLIPEEKARWRTMIPNFNDPSRQNTLRGNIPAILDYLACYRFLDDCYGRKQVGGILSKVATNLKMDFDQIDNPSRVKIARKILNSKTVVNLFIGFLPEAEQHLQTHIDRYNTVFNLKCMSRTMAIDHDRRKTAMNLKGEISNDKDEILTADRVYNIFLDTENLVLSGSLQSKFHIHQHVTTKESLQKLLECYHSELANNHSKQLFNTNVNMNQTTLFEFFARHTCAGTKMSVILKEYHRGISQRSKALTHMPNPVGINDLGGMDLFKEKIMLYRKRLEAGKSSSRGSSIILTGVQGAGKTMGAYWAATYLKRDIYRFNVSAMMASLIGQTESNTDRELQIIRELGEIVLFIDEVEKIFGGVRSSHATDGGVLLRVMEKVMAFLEEENAGVFTMMTSNDLTNLPPELLRSGRISNIMFVDFPTEKELAEIISIHNRLELEEELELTSQDCIDLSQVFRTRCLYNGIDIREVFRAVSDKCIIEDRGPIFEDVITAFTEVQPNFEKHREKITETRDAGMRNYEPASSMSEGNLAYIAQAAGTVNEIVKKIKNPRIKSILQDQEAEMRKSEDITKRLGL